MKFREIVIIPLLLVFLLSCTTNKGVKDYYADYFPIGAAVNTASINKSTDLLAPHFNSITCENEMKPEVIYYKYKKWNFFPADEIANYARENNMMMRGHTFVWHRQMPGWFFSSGGGIIDKEGLLNRTREMMEVMAERYNDVIYAWDVVNEVISDEHDEYLRPSPFKDIIGDDYVAEMFIMAREVMPDQKLFYNDYSCLDPVKQDKIYKLVKDMVDRGVPIDGVGFQGHWNVSFPDRDTLAKGIKRFADLGLEVQITELDISVYEHNDLVTRHPSLPEDLKIQQAERYKEVFEVLRDNQEYITGVTFWGIADDITWLDNYPVKKRKNWPLIFDENHQPKELAYKAVTKF